MLDFNKIVDDARKAIQMIIPYCDCLAWEDFSDRGNPCYNPLLFENETDIKEDALWHAAVKAAMPHGSDMHSVLASKVATVLNNKWVTYDWLIKALSRVINTPHF